MLKINRLARIKNICFAISVLFVAIYGGGYFQHTNLQNSQSVSYKAPPVIGYGNAPVYSSNQKVIPNSVVVGMAMTPDNMGYWLVTAMGQVFNYGDAPDLGSLNNPAINAPIVAITSTPDGKGYWLVGADGSVYTFGDATSYGSATNLKLNGPIVAMAATPDGRGYWMVASDGGVFSFGDATYFGSMGGKYLAGAIVAMAATPNGGGYWLVGADGGIFTFGNATFFGSMGGTVPNVPISSIVETNDGGGYYLLSPDSFNYRFLPTANERVTRFSEQTVIVAESQVGPTSSPGSFCNPYGPCEEWCSLFAGWVWNQAGIAAPSDGFTGYLYDWVAQHQKALSPSSVPAEGDYVFYGTGPRSSSTSVHMGIVVQSWPNGSLVTIEGDSGPGSGGNLGVTINGPFLISHSLEQNGAPIYAFGEPIS